MRGSCSPGLIVREQDAGDGGGANVHLAGLRHYSSGRSRVLRLRRTATAQSALDGAEAAAPWRSGSAGAAWALHRR